MQTIIDYIKSKSLTDSSMAMIYKMLQENVGMQEECILALLQSMYETNRNLGDEILKLRKQNKIVIR